eukprot:NODE_732_length_1389_cov_244.183658.p2 GENE.NODE_732_length_1389_cov_244.183658~~NODE_732_length_1389_cov_244.183658.p2  ORF type:complete len:394 (+),score=123.97 NODE_732_length_1389_cov_244.183658:104-1285(+)
MGAAASGRCCEDAADHRVKLCNLRHCCSAPISASGPGGTRPMQVTELRNDDFEKSSEEVTNPFKDTTPEALRKRSVCCPHGHPMRARLAVELLELVFGYMNDQDCDLCGKELKEPEAYYRCRICDIDYCLNCVRLKLGLCPAMSIGLLRPALRLLPGDVLLFGPDRFGIHHVVLVRGELEDAQDVGEYIDVTPGAKLLSCDTIESNRTTSGDDHWWYATRTLLERDAHAGTAFVIGDAPRNSDAIFLHPRPAAVKVLLHPLREELGGPELNRPIFELAVKSCEARSQKYSWNTAVSAFFAFSELIDAAHYPSVEEKADLLPKIMESWQRPPICSAVVVQVWQQYCLFLHAKDPQLAMSRILEWMPLWCNLTRPSSMVNVLTKGGWMLYESLET